MKLSILSSIYSRYLEKKKSHLDVKDLLEYAQVSTKFRQIIKISHSGSVSTLQYLIFQSEN